MTEIYRRIYDYNVSLDSIRRMGICIPAVGAVVMSKFKVGDRVRVARKTDGAARNLSSYRQWFDAVYNAPASIIGDLGPDSKYRYVIQLDDVALQHRYNSSFYVCADVELEAMLPELPEDL